jgi:hypothetical protein
MPVPPTQKIDLPGYVLMQGVKPIEDFLVANGWAEGTDSTHAYACAAYKLGTVDNLGGTVNIHFERTPAHIQITVD